MSPSELAARFFLQLAVICAAGRLCARLARPLLQPPVVGEMVAGILLGPSLLGWAAPDLHAWLFPKAGMPLLFAVSQLGLVLFMFCVGLDFRVEHLSARWKGAALVSAAGIVAPLVAGGALGLALHGRPGLFMDGVGPWHAAAFGGAAVCITAFPVLARIIVERGLLGTPLGSLVLAAAALDDVVAWSLVAVLLASLSGDPGLAAAALAGGGALAAAVYWGVRPAARRLVESAGQEVLGAGGMTAALGALALGAWLAEAAGLHAVFGAFMLGLAMPRGRFAERLRGGIEPLTTALLVPVFFAYSGLNTRLGLLGDGSLWLAAGAVLLVSTGAKGGACALAAARSGCGWAEATAVGALMNARGLMELVLLNIALERGLITQAAFTIYALMAVITTAGASPLFELVRGRLPEWTVKTARREEAVLERSP